MLAPNSRIGVGITKDNKLVFVMTHSPIYLGRLAKVMKDLGCEQAMNLDAGTSTGFYCAGHLLACPGRRLTNAIVVYANGRPEERTAGRDGHEDNDAPKPPA
jgi:exopolysaccharide biosynthesis protein